jgi:hypothetical protein
MPETIAKPAPFVDPSAAAPHKQSIFLGFSRSP